MTASIVPALEPTGSTLDAPLGQQDLAAAPRPYAGCRVAMLSGATTPRGSRPRRETCPHALPRSLIGPRSDDGTPARPLDLWVRQTCPYHLPGDLCRIAARWGPCRMIARDGRRCDWAEGDGARLLTAPQSVLDDYLRGRMDPRRVQTERGDGLLSGRPCPGCEAPLPSRRRLCDHCRGKARRRTLTAAQRTWRRRRVGRLVGL
jgi:hypothetical protein